MSEAPHGPGERKRAGLIVFGGSLVIFAGVLALAAASVRVGAPDAAGAAPWMAADAGRVRRDGPGASAYAAWCRPCHGDAGDGRGPSARGLSPPPRDLRQAQFKFGWVVDGLPRDEDLRRIVRGGLHGTAMLGWSLTDRELDAVVARVKWFAPQVWAEEPEGMPVVPPPDPWGARRQAEAVARGRDVYHGVAQCWSCHPGYAPREEIERLRGTTDVRAGLELAVARESSYLGGGARLVIVPPDFTLQPLRSVRKGSELHDLYRVIAAGIPGTAMPTWEGSLPPEDLWALAYFVDDLARRR